MGYISFNVLKDGFLFLKAVVEIIYFVYKVKKDLGETARICNMSYVTFSRFFVGLSIVIVLMWAYVANDKMSVFTSQTLSINIAFTFLQLLSITVISRYEVQTVVYIITSILLYFIPSFDSQYIEHKGCNQTVHRLSRNFQ